jgi:hypothetical protein
MKASTRTGIVLVIFLVSLVLMAYGASAVSATDSSTTGVEPGQKAQWYVTASSGVTATWYSETFMPRGNYSLPVGSIIALNLTSVVDSEIRANISVGGLVLTNVSMPEISYNLLLGWYPFNPGLVCPVNWDVQRQNATSNGFTVEDSGPVSAGTITFTHLNGTVGTKLTYDKTTGLLISGYGSFGKFLIEVALIPETASETTIAISISLVVLAIVIIAGWLGSARGRRTPRQT